METRTGGKYRAFVVCNCCGETFRIEDIDTRSLLDHQKDNKDCKGYFDIEVKGGRKF